MFKRLLKLYTSLFYCLKTFECVCVYCVFFFELRTALRICLEATHVNSTDKLIPNKQSLFASVYRVKVYKTNVTARKRKKNKLHSQS